MNSIRMEQVMRYVLTMICGVLLAAGCGVNPDRMAAMKDRGDSIKERGPDGERGSRDGADGDDAEDAPPLEFDDNDPAPIREAVMALQDLQKLVKQRAYAEYLAKRYELMKIVSYEAGEEVATSSKTPLIIGRVHDLDMRVAKAGGASAEEVVGTVGRVEMASADALYALNDAFKACEEAVTASDAAAMDDARSKYRAGLQRAESVDGKSLTFVGENAPGGDYIDVPAEVAVCEARLAKKEEMAADAPPAPEDKSRTTTGCGFYPIELEADQTGDNQFGDFLITSAYVADADPGSAKPVACEEIPPVTDAPSEVTQVIQEFVAWLQPDDVISMAGNFTYETEPDGKLTKQGTARVYRKSATLKTNKCGGESGKVTCEAEESTLATAFNQANHYLERADVHRKQGDPDHCKKMANMAYKAADVTSSESTDLQFQVRGGQKMQHAEITGKLEELESQAQARMSGDWCANR